MINGSVRFEVLWQPYLVDEDVRAMLTQTYDLNLCEFLKERLRPGDIVLDVGANVGYVSAVAASYVGTGGEVHGFEPLKMCFERLSLLRSMNPEFRFVFNNVALGDREGDATIAYDPVGESRNATLLPGMPEIKGGVRSTVPVKRLDDYIRENIPEPERIKLIKIDVEGFEFMVLKGLERFLTGSSHRPPIVCEIKPWALRKLGFDVADFEAYMKEFGYESLDPVDTRRRISIRELTDMETLLFEAQFPVGERG